MSDLIESLWLYGKDGSMHRAHIYQERVESLAGQKTALLQDGTHLNYVDENTFKNVVTGELLSREKPVLGRP